MEMKVCKNVFRVFRVFVLLVGLGPALGDGEFLSELRTEAPVPAPTVSVASESTSYDCNPHDGQEYLIFGNGNGITAESCGSSWDLHEIQIWDEMGNPIQNLQAEALTGYSSGYPASNAVDGSTSSFWAGDHDIGMSCSCWDSSKKDGQSIRIHLGSWTKVSKIVLTQGGAGNAWAISNIRIHCASSYQSNPLPLQISFGSTDIECSAAGCATTRMDPAYVHTCDMGMSSRASAPLFFLVAMALALLGTFFE
eukprot:Skav220765  [mRNA]  locus=scaffold3169:28184:35942:+ [translate_table: standard]